MRYLPLDFVKPHQYLAQAIYNKQFIEQLFDDGQLHASRVDSLKRLGYHSVFVREANRPDVSNAITHSVLSDLYSRINTLFITVEKISLTWHPNKQIPLPLDHQKKINVLIEDLDLMGENLAIELLRQNQPVLHLYESKSLVLYPVQHALHTALITLKLGLRCNLNIKTLKVLFLGSILNDIGYLFTKDVDISKSGLLNQETKYAQQVHVRYTHQLLSQLTSVNGMVRNICLQHHEREDGQGYPSAIGGANLNPLTKILTVAISYDALVSDRPFRPAYPPHKAITLMRMQQGKQFDKKILDFLSQIISPFPLGTLISYQKKVGLVATYDPTHLNPTIQFEDQSTSRLSDLIDGPLGLNFQS